MKPALLFISPTLPVPTGHGLGMRAYAIISALSAQNRVYLIVTEKPPEEKVTLEAVKKLCTEIVFHPLGLRPKRFYRLRAIIAMIPALYRLLFPLPHEWKQVSKCGLTNPFSIREFKTVHVFRFYMIPLLECLREKVLWQISQVDIDDIESLTHRRIASIQRLDGNKAKAVQLEIEAEQYAKLEVDWLNKFDRLFVCSSVDCKRILKKKLHRSPEILPNVVDCINMIPFEQHDEFRFLFVGTLSYTPNKDAIFYFCHMILPLIKALINRDIVFDVVGGGLNTRVKQELQSYPGLNLLGEVKFEELGKIYAHSNAVVVPIRAGGGTRIKILEAFAYGRPVVSTPEGIEGIAAINGNHALIAESAESFAKACVRLINDPALSSKLTAQANLLLTKEYSRENLVEVLNAR